MKIDRLDVYPLRYAMTGFFKFFSDREGAGGRAAEIVKITDDDGTVGWGQSVPIAKWSYETWETAFILLERYFGPVRFLTDDVLVEPVNLDSGRVPPPKGPGLGVEVDEEKTLDPMERSGGRNLLRGVVR